MLSSQYANVKLMRSLPRLRAFSVVQNADKDKPVSDQWLPPFVIVDKEDKPVGTVEVSPPPLEEVNTPVSAGQQAAPTSGLALIQLLCWHQQLISS